MANFGGVSFPDVPKKQEQPQQQDNNDNGGKWWENVDWGNGNGAPQQTPPQQTPPQETGGWNDAGAGAPWWQGGDNGGGGGQRSREQAHEPPPLVQAAQSGGWQDAGAGRAKPQEQTGGYMDAGAAAPWRPPAPTPRPAPQQPLDLWLPTLLAQQGKKEQPQQATGGYEAAPQTPNYGQMTGTYIAPPPAQQPPVQGAGTPVVAPTVTNAASQWLAPFLQQAGQWVSDATHTTTPQTPARAAANAAIAQERLGQAITNAAQPALNAIGSVAPPVTGAIGNALGAVWDWDKRNIYGPLVNAVTPPATQAAQSAQGAVGGIQMPFGLTNPFGGPAPANSPMGRALEATGGNEGAALGLTAANALAAPVQALGAGYRYGVEPFFAANYAQSHPETGPGRQLDMQILDLDKQIRAAAKQAVATGLDTDRAKVEGLQRQRTDAINQRNQLQNQRFMQNPLANLRYGTNAEVERFEKEADPTMQFVLAAAGDPMNAVFPMLHGAQQEGLLKTAWQSYGVKQTPEQALVDIAKRNQSRASLLGHINPWGVPAVSDQTHIINESIDNFGRLEGMFGKEQMPHVFATLLAGPKADPAEYARIVKLTGGSVESAPYARSIALWQKVFTPKGGTGPDFDLLAKAFAPKQGEQVAEDAAATIASKLSGAAREIFPSAKPIPLVQARGAVNNLLGIMFMGPNPAFPMGHVGQEAVTMLLDGYNPFARVAGMNDYWQRIIGGMPVQAKAGSTALGGVLKNRPEAMEFIGGLKTVHPWWSSSGATSDTLKQGAKALGLAPLKKGESRLGALGKSLSWGITKAEHIERGFGQSITTQAHRNAMAQLWRPIVSKSETALIELCRSLGLSPQDADNIAEYLVRSWRDGLNPQELHAPIDTLLAGKGDLSTVLPTHVADELEHAGGGNLVDAVNATLKKAAAEGAPAPAVPVKVAPIPPPSKLMQMISSGEVDVNQLTDAERKQLSNELSLAGRRSKVGVKANKVQTGEVPPAFGESGEPVAVRPPSPTKPGGNGTGAAVLAPEEVDVSKMTPEDLQALIKQMQDEGVAAAKPGEAAVAEAAPLPSQGGAHPIDLLEDELQRQVEVNDAIGQAHALGMGPTPQTEQEVADFWAGLRQINAEYWDRYSARTDAVRKAIEGAPKELKDERWANHWATIQQDQEAVTDAIVSAIEAQGPRIGLTPQDIAVVRKYYADELAARLNRTKMLARTWHITDTSKNAAEVKKAWDDWRIYRTNWQTARDNAAAAMDREWARMRQMTVGGKSAGAVEGVRAPTPVSPAAPVSPSAEKPPVSETPDAKTGSVPMFISKGTRQQLYDLGYTRADVDAMAPADAQRIVTAGTTKPRPAAPPPVEPPPAAAPPGIPTNQELRDLAQQARINTVTEKGETFDNYFYNALNKDLGLEQGTIKKLSDLTDEQRMDLAAAWQARAERVEPVEPTWEQGPLAKGQAGKKPAQPPGEAAPAGTGTEIGRNEVRDILAAQPGNAGRDPERLADRWIASQRFQRMTIPIDSVGIASEPVGKSVTQGPIIVDRNIAEAGRLEGRYGAPPDVLVIDGKHRLAEAKARGEKTIEAYVGDEARPYIERATTAANEREARAAAVIAEYKANPSGSTLRHLREILPENEVERIRAEVRVAKAPATPAVHRAKLRQQLIDYYKYTPQQADDSIAIWEQRGRLWAKQTGRNADEWLASHIYDIDQGAPGEGALFQMRPPETPEFRQWFGGSKVVDEAGRPKVMYHGTPNTEFEKFDVSKANADSLYGPGIYFSDSPTVTGGEIEGTRWVQPGYAQGGNAQFMLSRSPTAQDAEKAVKWLSQRTSWGDKYRAGFNEARWALQAGDMQRFESWLNKWGSIQAEVGKYLGIEREPALTGRMIPAFLNIAHPFEAEAAATKPVVTALMQRLQQWDRWDQYGRKIANALSPYLNGRKTGRLADVYGDLATALGRNGELDKALANEALKGAGYDGILHTGGAIMGTGTHNVAIAFDGSQVRNALSQRLMQGAEGGAKGAVTFMEDGRAIIHALQAPDISTIVHETGHIFRRDLADVARTDAKAAADLGILKKWAGVTGDEWSVEAEEKVARGFEQYMMSGQAPVKELQSVFARFKDWLTNIYAAVKGKVAPDMNADVRGVFDRMLAENPEIREVAPDYATARAEVNKWIDDTLHAGGLPRQVDIDRHIESTYGLDRMQAHELGMRIRSENPAAAKTPITPPENITAAPASAYAPAEPTNPAAPPDFAGAGDLPIFRGEAYAPTTPAAASELLSFRDYERKVEDLIDQLDQLERARDFERSIDNFEYSDRYKEINRQLKDLWAGDTDTPIDQLYDAYVTNGGDLELWRVPKERVHMMAMPDAATGNKSGYLYYWGGNAKRFKTRAEAIASLDERRADAVKDALDAGEKVSADVLAEYPDIAKEYAKAEGPIGAEPGKPLPTWESIEGKAPEKPAPGAWPKDEAHYYKFTSAAEAKKWAKENGVGGTLKKIDTELYELKLEPSEKATAAKAPGGWYLDQYSKPKWLYQDQDTMGYHGPFTWAYVEPEDGKTAKELLNEQLGSELGYEQEAAARKIGGKTGAAKVAPQAPKATAKAAPKPAAPAAASEPKPAPPAPKLSEAEVKQVADTAPLPEGNTPSEKLQKLVDQGAPAAGSPEVKEAPPLFPIQMLSPNINAWDGNRAVAGRYVTDGFGLIDTEALPPKSNIAKLAEKAPASGKAGMKQENAAQPFDHYVKQATSDARLAGYLDPTNSDTEFAYAIFYDPDGKIHVADAARLRLLIDTTGATSVKVTPTGWDCFALYRDNKPVAVLMGMSQQKQSFFESLRKFGNEGIYDRLPAKLEWPKPGAQVKDLPEYKGPELPPYVPKEMSAADAKKYVLGPVNAKTGLTKGQADYVAAQLKTIPPDYFGEAESVLPDEFVVDKHGTLQGTTPRAQTALAEAKQEAYGAYERHKNTWAKLNQAIDAGDEATETALRQEIGADEKAYRAYSSNAVLKSLATDKMYTKLRTPFEIRVPGDGVLTVRSEDQANLLHYRLTGKPLRETSRKLEAKSIWSQPLGIVPPWVARSMGADPMYAAKAGSTKQTQGILGMLRKNGHLDPQALPKLTPKQAKALHAFVDDQLSGQLYKATDAAGKYSTMVRNHALLDYADRHNINSWLAWIFPYNFWYGAAYKEWVSRLATNPVLISDYVRFRKMLKDINTQLYREQTGDPNAEVPDYMAYQIHVPFMGTDLQFSLDRWINPLYRMVEPFTRSAVQQVPAGNAGPLPIPSGATVEKLNGYGPSIWAPIGWALQANYSARGYNEAAAQMGGYQFPPSKVIKGLTAQARENIPGAADIIPAGGWTPEELVNPSVRGGDYWTQRRIPYFVYQLYKDKQISAEEMQEAQATHEGPVWERAKQAEALYSSVPNMANFLSGLGVRVVRPIDQEIENGWQAWYKLPAYGTVTPAQWMRQADLVDQQFPWLKAAKMGRNFDWIDRLQGFAGMVMDRIAPGDARAQALQSVGIQDLYYKMLDDKSRIDYTDPRSNFASVGGWTQPMLDTLKQGLLTLGRQFNVPSPDVAGEYDKAQQEWSDRNNLALLMTQQQGYSVSDATISALQSQRAQAADKDMFDLAHPELPAYWNNQRLVDQQGIPAQNGQPAVPPEELKRVGDTYHTSPYEQQEKQLFGDDILDLNQQYSSLPKGTANKTSPERRAWQNAHPQEYLRLAKLWAWEDNNPETQPAQATGGMPVPAAQAANVPARAVTQPQIPAPAAQPAATKPMSLWDVIQAAFPGDPTTQQNMLKIAMRESGGNPKAINNTADPNQPGYRGKPGPNAMPELSVGLFQINVLAHPEYTVADMQDPVKNVQAAAKLLKARPDYGDWKPYNQPAIPPGAANIERAKQIMYGAVVAQQAAGRTAPGGIQWAGQPAPAAAAAYNAPVGTLGTQGESQYSGRLSTVEKAQRRADLAAKYTSKVLSLMDEYSSLVNPDGTPDTMARRKWKLAHNADMPMMEDAWSTMNENGMIPPGYNWQRNLSLPSYVQTYMDYDLRDKMSETDVKRAETWLTANVPGQYQQPGEWVQARVLDDNYYYQIAQQFADNITDLSSAYGKLDKAQKRTFLAANPQLKAYWSFRDAYAAANPLWAKYYGNVAGSTQQAGFGYGGGGGHGYGGGRGGSYSSSNRYPAPPPPVPLSPTPEQQERARAEAMTADDYNGRVSSGRNNDPAFDPLVTLTFGSNIFSLASNWFAMDATGRSAWMTANPALYAKLLAYLMWLLRYTNGTAARTKGSIPPGTNTPPPPEHSVPAGAPPPPPSTPPATTPSGV